MKENSVNYLIGGVLALSGCVLGALLEYSVNSSITGTAHHASQKSHQTSVKEVKKSIPAFPLEKLVSQSLPKGQVLGTFNGPFGLTGVIVNTKDGQSIAWTNKEHQYLVFGSLYSENGNNLTIIAVDALRKQLQEKKDRLKALAGNNVVGVNSSDAANNITSDVNANNTDNTAQNSSASTTDTAQNSLGAQLIKEIQAMHPAEIVEGFGPVDMYVFFDPGCPHCQDFYKNLSSIQGWKSEFTVHFIPLSVTSLSTSAQAAYLLEHPEYMKSFDTKKVPDSHNAEYIKKVERNNAAYQALISKNKLDHKVPIIVTDNIVHQGSMHVKEIEQLYSK